MTHRCHAIGCDFETEPKFFMCPHHWKMVPKDLKEAVWAAYRPGQEDDKRPSGEYLGAARRAMTAVAIKERKVSAGSAPKVCEVPGCGATAPFGFFVFRDAAKPGFFYCHPHKYLGEAMYRDARAPAAGEGPMPRQGSLL